MYNIVEMLKKTHIPVAAVIISLCLAGEAFCEARGRIIIKSPGVLNTVGQSATTYQFQQFSYGLGGLSGSSPGPGGNVLKSTIDTSSNFRIRTSAGGTGGSLTGTDLKTVDKGIKLSSPTEIIKPVSGGNLSSALNSQNTSALGIARAYASAIGAGTEHLTKGMDEPITSLVPQRPSLYRNYMKKGDDAFREDKFHSAFRYFKMANNIAGRDPESLLSLAHSSFAVSMGSYARVSYYLRRALEYFPELPLVNLQPRDFYGNPATYADHLFRLENHLRDYPRNPEGLLLLAYFRWFEGRRQEAAELLRRARAVSQDPALLESISIFWDGMVASGEVAGSLEPTTQPAGQEDQDDQDAEDVPGDDNPDSDEKFTKDT